MKKKHRHLTLKRKNSTLTAAENTENIEDRAEKTRISVCLIVKNEERFIENCLNSIQPVADEIIIVDTGSTDRTVEICRKYTDRIYFHSWKDSFSEARNHCLDYAKGDWIFQIDADEELVKEDIPTMLEAVRNPGIDGIMVQIASRFGEGKKEGIHAVERIFRRNGTIRYQGRVHNRITGMVNARVYPIRLIHYGYDLDPAQARRKFDRTVALLKMDLAEDPQNPLTYHYLSSSYLTQGMDAETIEAGLKAIRLAEAARDPNRIYLWTRYNVAMACYRLKDFNRAEEIALSSHRNYPKHIDAHFILTLTCYERQKWEDVIHHGTEYERLLCHLRNNPVEFENLVTCTAREEWNIHVLVGIAFFELGRHEKGTASIEKAVAKAPDPWVAMRAAGVYFYQKKDHPRACSYLERTLREKPGEEGAQTLLAEIKSKVSKNATISCCMIVKNEEALLSQCLQSVKDFVDEIVIVDTGSTDGTVEIAKRFTDQIYFHPWEGSFSKARNQALAYATGDWIFQIDGDEELVEGSGPILRETVRNAGDADAILLNIISPYSNGQKRARHSFERLFRRNGSIHYEGIVHNRVVGYNRLSGSRIDLLHHGYNVEEKKAKEKFVRTTELLKQQVAEDPLNPLPHHYLGVSYLSRGMDREAADESIRAIELAEAQGNRHHIYIWSHHNAALAFFRMKNLEKAERYSRYALEKYPDHLDSHYTLTLTAAEQGQWKNVLRHGGEYLRIRQFLDENPDQSGIIVHTTISEGSSIYLLMGHAFHSLGNRTHMSEHYRHAVDMAEVEWQAWWNAGTFHLDRSGNLELADQYLRKALEAAPEEQSVWYTLAKLNRRCNRPGEERQWLERLASGNCRDVVVFNRLTTLRLDAGDLDGACAAAESTLRIDPDNYPALCSLGRVHRRQGRPELAVEQFSRAAETYTAGAEAWIQLGEVCLDMKEANQAGIFFERALSLEPQSIPVLLGLLETTLLGGDFVKAVTWSDRAMKALDIRQSRMIDTFEDFALILLDILFALQDKPERSRVRRVLALLPLNRGSMSCYVRDIQGINEERKAFFIQEIGGLQGEARSA